MKESELLGLVKERLQPFCRRLIRINGGTFRGAGGIPIKTYRLYGKGEAALTDEVLPDLMGFLPDGRLLAVEVKTKTRTKTSVTRVREARQNNFLEAVNAVGGIGEMVESLEALDRLIEKISLQKKMLG